MLTLCVAMDRNRAIGYRNALPWHLPADLKHFKSITWGKPIIMGRKTYESIGRPLPGRTNIVLTRQSHNFTDCLQFQQLEAVLKFSQQVEECVVIGGASIYRLLLPYVQKMYITLVDSECQGDTYFPDYQAEQWQEIERQNFAADKRHAYAYSFTVLKRYVCQS